MKLKKKRERASLERGQDFVSILENPAEAKMTWRARIVILSPEVLRDLEQAHTLDQ